MSVRARESLACCLSGRASIWCEKLAPVIFSFYFFFPFCHRCRYIFIIRSFFKCPILLSMRQKKNNPKYSLAQNCAARWNRYTADFIYSLMLQQLYLVVCMRMCMCSVCGSRSINVSVSSPHFWRPGVLRLLHWQQQKQLEGIVPRQPPPLPPRSHSQHSFSSCKIKKKKHPLIHHRISLRLPASVFSWACQKSISLFFSLWNNCEVFFHLCTSSLPLCSSADQIFSPSVSCYCSSIHSQVSFLTSFLSFSASPNFQLFTFFCCSFWDRIHCCINVVCKLQLLPLINN